MIEPSGFDHITLRYKCTAWRGTLILCGCNTFTTATDSVLYNSDDFNITDSKGTETKYVWEGNLITSLRPKVCLSFASLSLLMSLLFYLLLPPFARVLFFFQLSSSLRWLHYDITFGFRYFSIFGFDLKGKSNDAVAYVL